MFNYSYTLNSKNEKGVEQNVKEQTETMASVGNIYKWITNFLFKNDSHLWDYKVIKK